MTHSPDLAALLVDPARAADVSADAIPSLLAGIGAEQSRLAALQAALAGRLAMTTASETTTETDGLLTIPEVAKRLGVPRQYAYELARRELPAVRFGKYVRVRSGDLDAWVARHRDRP